MRRASRRLQSIFERACLVAGTGLASGCCGLFFTRWVPPSDYVSVFVVNVSRDPTLMARAAEPYSEALPVAICESHCGRHAQGCSLAKVEGEANASRAEPRALRDVLLCRIHVPGECVTHIPSGRAPRAFDAQPLVLSDVTAYLTAAARLEAASVIAFDDLAVSLEVLGAPPDLVRRCQVAARDERFHARVFGELAGVSVAASRRAGDSAPLPASLFDLTLENAIEGCVIETYSALVTLHQSRHARDPRLAAVLPRVAAEELGHAVLSWDLLAWSWPQLSAPARERLVAAMVEAESALAARLPDLPPEMTLALGLPTIAASRALLGTLGRSLWRAEGFARAPLEAHD